MEFTESTALTSCSNYILVTVIIFFLVSIKIAKEGTKIKFRNESSVSAGHFRKNKRFLKLKISQYGQCVRKLVITNAAKSTCIVLKLKPTGNLKTNI